MLLHVASGRLWFCGSPCPFLCAARASFVRCHDIKKAAKKKNHMTELGIFGHTSIKAVEADVMTEVGLCFCWHTGLAAGLAIIGDGRISNHA